VNSSELADLARACRILALEGHNDLTLGHLSLRDHSPGRFWCKRAAIGLDEVRGPEDLVLLDYEGEKLGGDGQCHKEWPIHAGILRARPDVRVVGHTHSPWATRLSATAASLVPVANYGAVFAGRLPRFELTSDLIDTPALGEELAAALGDGPAILLRNHGAVFCGSSIPEATLTGIWLERAAADALLLGASRAPVTVPEENELRAKRQKTFAPPLVEGFWQYLCRRLAAVEGGRDPRADAIT
jgi:L-fuculose-phosphate aldolase